MANAAITVDLNAKIAQFETELKKATGSLDKFGQKGNQIASGFKAAFGALSVGALAAVAKSSIDAADALGKMSARTGVAVKDLAALQLSADSADTSLEDVAKALLRLNVSVGDAATGNKSLGESLARLGVTATEPKERLYQLADAVKAGGGSAQTASDLNKVLGKSYTNLLPLLQQGGDALRESAKASESFADTMARLSPNAEKFNDQLDVLRQNAAAAVASGLLPLVDALNRVFERYQTIAQLGASGASILDIITGKASADTGASLKRYNADILQLESTITRLRKNSGGLDSSIAPLSAELARLKKVRAELQSLEVSRIQTPPGSKSTAGKPASSPALSFDSAAKSKAGGAKSDPQGAFVSGLRKEAETLGLTGEALQRYEAAKLKLSGINKKLADSYITQIAAFKEQQEAAKANNEAFDEAIKKQEALDATLESSIKSVREWIAEQEFEVSLIGLSNAEREAAIQLRALETAGIDTQTESYKRLAEQVAAANSDKRGLSLLSGTQTEKTKDFLADIDSLNKLFFDGKIGAQQFAEGIDLITGSTDKAKVQMDDFAKNAAENIQKSFAEFLFDPFDNGVKGMLQGFGTMLQRMIAEAVAADLAKKLFGDLAGGESGDSGVAGGLLKFVGSFFADGGIAAYGKPVAIPRFAGGGVSNTAAIFGEAGPEAAVPLPDGRRIPVDLRGAGGGNTYVVNVNGSNNAPDVRRAAGQGMREALGMINGAKRYG